MFRIYLKNTWRNLLKQRMTSLINIFGLATGMAAAALIFLWVWNEMNYDGEQPHAERIYRLKNFVAIDRNETWVWENSPYLLGEEIKKSLPDVEVVARAHPYVHAPMYLMVRNEWLPEKKAAYVDEDWIKLFPFTVVSGHTSAFIQNPFSLILSESAAKKYFGKEEAVGQSIRIDSNNYQVQATVKDPPVHSSFQFDVLIPVAAQLSTPRARQNAESWGNFNYLTFLRLREGSDAKKTGSAINRILQAKKKDDKVRLELLPLRDMHFESDLQNSTLLHADRKVVYIFSVLGILLLMIACINYVNLTTARASLRLKEVSIKKIMGAGKKQLLFQFVFESMVVSVIALLLSLLLMKAALPFFNQLTEKEFRLPLNDAGLWGILAGTLIVAVGLTSVYPALLLSSFHPMAIFRGMNVLRLKDVALRKVLVVAQFTFSIMLLIGVIVVYRQLSFIQKKHSSYDRAQVVSFILPYRMLRNYETEKRESLVQAFKQEISNQSSVQVVSGMDQNSIIDMRGFSSGGADWDGRDPEFNPSISYFNVERNFNSILPIECMAGGWFTDGADAGKEFILNETAVRELGLRKPVVGQRFVGQGDTGVIAGVVRDFHFRSLHEKISPMVMKCRNDGYRLNLFAKLHAGQVTQGLQVIAKSWNVLFPGQPFSYTFLDEEFDKLYRSDKRTATLIWLFAGIAVFISCLGLFGLAAFTAERRTKEVGIRKVLGASVAAIIRLLSGEFIFLVLLAFLVAVPLAWWGLNKWLEDFAYHVDISWWMLLLGGAAALLIALITVSFQAARAAVANPVKSLRTE